MAYDSVRAQLDKLLGPDRNGPLTDAPSNAAPHYTHDSVCKHYLLGFCPNDLYIKHRSEPGSCRLLHSDAARAAFKKDDDRALCSRDKLRWTRALLKECRLILSDEDRKIRGHARRLQVSYSASGNLSGLMIRDFNTLKKLGMVSEHAKVKVQTDLSDDDDGLDTDFSSAPDTLSASTAPQKSSTKNDHPDDIDGFGDVKIIPAGKHRKDETVDEFGRISKHKHSSNADKEEKQKQKLNSDADDADDSGDANDGEDNGGDDNDDDDFSDFEIRSPSSHNPSRSSTVKVDSDNTTKKPPLSTNDSTDDVSMEPKQADNTDGKGVDHQRDSRSHDSRTTDAHPGSKSEAVSSSDTRQQDGMVEKDSGKEDVSTVNRETEPLPDEPSSNKLTPEQIMNKFYETGQGPDGLMMLDRKQSLRVCACCGGFISLVDAESRLLSHYGGKSHHSLETLRKKVPEIDGLLTVLTTRLNEEESRASNSAANQHPYADRNQRPPSWYAQEDNVPGWMRREREPHFTGRYAHENGHSRQGPPPPPQYSNGAPATSYDQYYARDAYERRRDPGYDRDYGYDRPPARRYENERHAREPPPRRDHGRHSGHKRHRSPPPYSSNRRSRRY